jgi:hypothetical protein
MLAALAINIDPNGTDAGNSAVRLAMGAAALRICWPEGVAWPVRPRPRNWDLGTDLKPWAAEVFETLYAKSGEPLAQLAATLEVARGWAAASALTEREVKAAEDFSDAPEDTGA